VNHRLVLALEGAHHFIKDSTPIIGPTKKLTTR